MEKWKGHFNTSSVNKLKLHQCILLVDFFSCSFRRRCWPLLSLTVDQYFAHTGASCSLFLLLVVKYRQYASLLLPLTIFLMLSQVCFAENLIACEQAFGRAIFSPNRKPIHRLKTSTFFSVKHNALVLPQSVSHEELILFPSIES